MEIKSQQFIFDDEYNGRTTTKISVNPKNKNEFIMEVIVDRPGMEEPERVLCQPLPVSVYDKIIADILQKGGRPSEIKKINKKL